jgi:hypothetical protein
MNTEVNAMFREGFVVGSLGIILCGGLLSSTLRAGTADQKSNDQSALQVQVDDLHPFSHVAYIPAGSDVSTIRFERVKAVDVPTQIRYTTDPEYCADVNYGNRAPGGSMFCPSAETETPAAAYEVTYSYTGEPLASDEYANRHFTFDLYFQPGELAPEIRKAIAAGNLSRSDMAGYFTVKTSRGQMPQVVVDEAASTFCTGILKDGIWSPLDPACRSKAVYKTVNVASDYVGVQVDPLSTRNVEPNAGPVSTR